MALSKAQKNQIVELLAAGATASKAAEAAGCSRASVQRLKKAANFATVTQKVRGAAKAKQLNEQGEQLISTLSTLKEREPAIQDALWQMFDGLSGLFSQVLEQTEPADVSPRQLPALAKAAADIAQTYADYCDRSAGIDLLTDEIEKINKTRAA